MLLLKRAKSSQSACIPSRTTIWSWFLTRNLVRYARVSETPTPDFDGDGTVGFSDFLLFASAFGLSQGDAGYDARFDLDGDGTVGFGDFLIFAGSFGQGA